MRDFVRFLIREPIDDSGFNRAIELGSSRADRGMKENKPKEVYLGLLQASLSGGRYLMGRSFQELSRGDLVSAFASVSEAGVMGFTAVASTSLAIGASVNEVCNLRRHSR